MSTSTRLILFNSFSGVVLGSFFAWFAYSRGATYFTEPAPWAVMLVAVVYTAVSAVKTAYAAGQKDAVTTESASGTASSETGDHGE